MKKVSKFRQIRHKFSKQIRHHTCTSHTSLSSTMLLQTSAHAVQYRAADGTITGFTDLTGKFEMLGNTVLVEATTIKVAAAAAGGEGKGGEAEGEGVEGASFATAAAAAATMVERAATVCRQGDVSLTFAQASARYIGSAPWISSFGFMAWVTAARRELQQAAAAAAAAADADVEKDVSESSSSSNNNEEEEENTPFTSLDASIFAGKTVLELGAGVGVAGLYVAALSTPTSVCLTDLPEQLESLTTNIALNAAASRCEVTCESLDWRDIAASNDSSEAAYAPPPSSSSSSSDATAAAAAVAAAAEPTTTSSSSKAKMYDVVVAADCLYRTNAPPFLAAILATLKPGGRFLLVNPIRDGVDEFLYGLLEHGEGRMDKSTVLWNDQYPIELVFVDFTRSTGEEESK